MNNSTLLDFYQVASRRSHHQVPSSALEPLLPTQSPSTESRHEPARLAYLASKLDVLGLRIADVGGDTGYFSFELLARRACRVDYYDRNPAHCDFVRAAAARLGLSERLRTFHRHVAFVTDDLPDVDCTLVLNVLHQLGGDSDDSRTGRESVTQRILACLGALSRRSRHVVLQLGYNWRDDPQRPFFARGTKAELIDFVAEGTASDWMLQSIGVAEKSGDAVVFKDLNPSNITVHNGLSEALNRPLFVLRSRHR
jgi:SAM-dependent methyltransferase